MNKAVRYYIEVSEREAIQLKLMKRLVKEARWRLTVMLRIHGKAIVDGDYSKGRIDGEVFALRQSLGSLQATARRLVEPLEPHRCVCGRRTERHRGETGHALWCTACKERMKI